MNRLKCKTKIIHFHTFIVMELPVQWRYKLRRFLTTLTPQSTLGPFICSRYTTPAKCSRNMFSVHERSYYEHCEMFSVPIRMTYCVYTAQRVRSFWCALSVLIAVCVLSPAHLEHCSRYTSVHTCFGCVLRGRFVPRTWFDHVPAGTVLAGTILFRTPFRLQEMVCTENMFREHVPAGTVPRTSMNARIEFFMPSSGVCDWSLKLSDILEWYRDTFVISINSLSWHFHCYLLISHMLHGANISQIFSEECRLHLHQKTRIVLAFGFFVESC